MGFRFNTLKSSRCEPFEVEHPKRYTEVHRFFGLLNSVQRASPGFLNGSHPGGDGAGVLSMTSIDINQLLLEKLRKAFFYKSFKSE